MSKNKGTGILIIDLIIMILAIPFFILYWLIKGIIFLIKEKKYSKNYKKFNFNTNKNENLIEENKEPTISFYNENKTENEIHKYESKNLATNNEMYFYNIIENHFGNKYKIQTQVNLASIIEKTNNDKFRNELFRNIDIGIFEKENLKPLLLIEINDSTHNQTKRQYRDIKVKEICNEANIKLITFYTKYSNKKEYIINRIEEELN